MSERAGYSRLYWTLVDDPKFATIYDDDRHFATWTRLLMMADQSHPASAHLPSNVRKTSVQILSDVGLIDLQPGHRFRVRGLDAERERRRLAATSRGTVRSPSGHHSGLQNKKSGPLDETRRDEEETRRDDAGDRDSLDTYHELTLYRPWGLWSGDKLKVAINDFGDAAVDAALREEATVDSDRKTMLDRALARLARNADRASDRAREQRKSKPRLVPNEAERRRVEKELRGA